MPEGKNEPITEKKVSRRSLLKWTGALAAAVAVGVGAGYETNQLLRPVTTMTQTATLTQPLIEEQVFPTSATGHSTGRGEPIRAHVRGGRIAWVEPLQLTDDEYNSTWTITAGGKSFKPPRISANSPQGLAYRSRWYCTDRLKYPLKRVGFQPGGTGDVSNRGKGEFVRITWQEALDTVANEVKRIKTKYGNSAISAWYAAHPEGGYLHHREQWARFMNAPFLGGYTRKISFGDSWGYWSYAGPFTWGFHWAHGEADVTDLLEDTLQNSKLVVFWGTNPITVGKAYGGNETAPWFLWLKQLGIRMVCIDPICTDTAALSDQWIPIKPQTDTAMALAIAYIWITEGTYDKDYVATHTVAFDKFSDYVLGKKDGPDGKAPRTPDWASKITGLPVATITTLAREWASKPTTLACYDGGLCRISYGQEWGRMMILLQAMQGVGKPGVNLHNFCIKGKAEPEIINLYKGVGGPNEALMAGVVTTPSSNPVAQAVHRLNLPDAILTDFTKNPPIVFPPPSMIGGSGDAAGWLKNEDAFNSFTYPMAGYSEIHMVWRFGSGGGTGVMDIDAADQARWRKSPKIEFFVIQAPRMETEVMFADIVLPTNVTAERNDVGDMTVSGYLMLYWRKLVDSLGESMSDYDILTGLAERLGFKAAFTEGNSEDDWLRKLYQKSTIPGLPTWEDFKAKGYYQPPFPKDYKSNPGLRWYYTKPGSQITGPTNGLDTPSGKIEFQSKLLTSHYGEGPTDPDVPKYFQSPFGPWGDRAKKYPLAAIISKFPYRDHSKWRNASFLKDLYEYKGYVPFWINPADAQVRGINESDIMRLFNDTGQILGYAHVTERVVQGAVWVPWGAWYKAAEPGNPDSIDIGGNGNTLVSREPGSYVYDTYEGSVMMQVEKWKG